MHTILIIDLKYRFHNQIPYFPNKRPGLIVFVGEIYPEYFFKIPENNILDSNGSQRQ